MAKYMKIRDYKAEDCKLLAELFYETVHTVNAKDYNEEQLSAWADGELDLDKWNRSFLEHYTVVAVEDNVIAGFGDIDGTGYLDRLYVHKDYQNRGIGTAICNALEIYAGTEKIRTQASITAKSFFMERGYVVIREQQVERKGIKLTNYFMEKQIDKTYHSNTLI